MLSFKIIRNVLSKVRRQSNKSKRGWYEIQKNFPVNWLALPLC